MDALPPGGVTLDSRPVDIWAHSEWRSLGPTLYTLLPGVRIVSICDSGLCYHLDSSCQPRAPRLRGAALQDPSWAASGSGKRHWHSSATAGTRRVRAFVNLLYNNNERNFCIEIIQHNCECIFSEFRCVGVPDLYAHMSSKVSVHDARCPTTLLTFGGNVALTCRNFPFPSPALVMLDSTTLPQRATNQIMSLSAPCTVLRAAAPQSTRWSSSSRLATCTRTGPSISAPRRRS